jgi:hypothetical protein
MKELTEAENQVTEETRELLASLGEKQTKLIEYQTNIVNIKEFASDLQTFIAVKQIEKDVETHDTFILCYIFKNSYLLTVFMIFHVANSTTRTLVFFTV